MNTFIGLFFLAAGGSTYISDLFSRVCVNCGKCCCAGRRINEKVTKSISTEEREGRFAVQIIIDQNDTVDRPKRSIRKKKLYVMLIG